MRPAPVRAPALWKQHLAPSTRYLAPADREQCYRALELAHVAHEGQRRKDGQPFITHPIAVASLVSEWRMDGACVAAALLHDSVEDTPLTLGEVDDCFGPEGRFLVKGVTKTSKLPPPEAGRLLPSDNEDLLGLLNACAADWRVAVLKLAD